MCSTSHVGFAATDYTYSSVERVSKCLEGVYGTSEQVGACVRKNYIRLSFIFRCIDLSVHRTRLMKESHDHLLQLCSSSDKDFLNIQVPPTKLTKRKKGNLPSHSQPLVSDRYHQVLGGNTT